METEEKTINIHEKLLLKPKTVAVLTDQSVSQVYRLISEGTLGSVRCGRSNPGTRGGSPGIHNEPRLPAKLAMTDFTKRARPQRYSGAMHGVSLSKCKAGGRPMVCIGFRLVAIKRTPYLLSRSARSMRLRPACRSFRLG